MERVFSELMENQNCQSAYLSILEESNAASYMPGVLSFCSTFDTILNSCSIENSCFSQREMDLIKDVLKILYKTAMDTVVRAHNMFGGKGFGIRGQAFRLFSILKELLAFVVLRSLLPLALYSDYIRLVRILWCELQSK